MELDLDAEGASKTAFLHGVEHRFEINVAVADRGKIPDTPFAALVLYVAMDQLRQRNLQIGDGIDAAVELTVQVEGSLRELIALSFRRSG